MDGSHRRYSIPYDNLHIYYIEGRLTPADTRLGACFIGNWEEENFSFLFFSAPADHHVRQLLQVQPQLTLLDKYNIPYADWLGERPAPFCLGRFVISPPWQKADVPEDKLPITIDPGVVFGTGTHPTTRDCLNALTLACQSNNIGSVIDIGTGTGLLAIAAARLGCEKILAVDLNHLAAKTALGNVVRNRLEDRILVVRGKAEECSAKPVDLVVANIHFDVMKHILNSAVFSQATYFILSGLLRSQAKAIAETPALRRARIIEKWNREGIWHTFFGKVSRG